MKIRATIDFDHWAESPNEYGGWRLHSFSLRHNSFTDPDEFGAGGARAGQAVFGLSYYEHGNCLWRVAGAPFEAGDGPGGYYNFDFTPIAGVLTWEDSTPLSEVFSTDEAARASAEAFVEDFTRWSNGETYLVSFHEVSGCGSCGHETEELIDSTSVLGYDEAVAEAHEYGQSLVDAGETLEVVG